MSNTPPALSGLARRLVSDGLLAQELAQQAQAQAMRERVPFVQHLVTAQVLDARTIAHAAADEFGTPLFDLDSLVTEHIPTQLVDQKLIQKHHTLPVMKRGNRLFVALADPTNLHALDEIKFNTGVNTEPVLVEADKLAAAIDRYLNAQEATLGDALGDLDGDELDGLDVQAVSEDAAEDDKASEADEAPIVSIIYKLLHYSYRSRTADFHFISSDYTLTVHHL